MATKNENTSASSTPAVPPQGTASRPASVSEHVEGVDESKAAEVGADKVQEATDKAEEQGYIGIKVDELPNSAYSLEGGPPTAGNTSAK